MNLYGNSCPMCCGDLINDTHSGRTAAAAVCRFCGLYTEASACVPPAASLADAMEFGVISINAEDAAAAAIGPIPMTMAAA